MFINGDNYNTNCYVSASSRVIYLYYTLNVSIAEKNLTVKLYSIKNPSSTAPTDPFIFRSQVDSMFSGTFYDIDTNITGVYYQVTTPYPFQKVKV